MTPPIRVCWLLAGLCTGCGARTGVEAVDLSAGGKPAGYVPDAGRAGMGQAAGAPSGPKPSERARVKSVAVGGRRSCAVLEDGLKCWGANLFGALGLEDLEARGDEPKEMGQRLPRVKLGTGVVVERVAPGMAEHSCALLTGGQIKCWGDDDFGQLGLETFLDRGAYPGEMGDALPVVELGPGAIVEQLAGGANHTCAVLRDGSLRCWGNNSNGQLGLGAVLTKGGVAGDMGSNLPAVNLGGARVLEVAAASVHTCVLLEGGMLKCWGWERGFEDEPVTPESPLTNVDLGGLRALRVAAGGGHSCVYSNDQSVRCWAVTEHATQAPQLAGPVDFGAPVQLEQLSVGGGRGCALLADASVRCWDIETGGAANRIHFGVGRRVIQMSAAGGRRRHHGCALLDDGSVKCWGENGDGQLGLGDVLPRDGSQPDSLSAVDLGPRATDP